jgi:hypothetical protein
MLGGSLGKAVCEFGMAGVEGKKRHYGMGKIYDMCMLRLFPPLSIGLLPFDKGPRGSLDLEIGPNPLDGCCRCPHAF